MSAEAAFVEHALGQRRLEAIRAAFVVGCFFNIGMWILATVFYAGAYIEIFQYIHPLMIALDLAAIVWFLRFPAAATARRLEAFYMGLNVVFFSGFALANYLMRVRHEDASMIALGGSVYCMSGLVAQAISPPAGRYAYLHALACVLPIIPSQFVSSGNTSVDMSYVLVPLGFFFGAWVNDSATRQQRRAALAEYKMRSRIAPAQIVRLSIGKEGEVGRWFEPKLRSCVCISSDWRNFQKAAQLIEPDELARTLGDFYTLCDRELARAMPDGNYFYDWIADELFVVVFVDDDDAVALAISQALAFCRAMLGAKKGFLETHAVPQAFDFGLAAGTALVGVMGADASPKATAIGEVCGRSRRLQTLGKLLRETKGHVDRVVFGEEVKRLAPPGLTTGELRAADAPTNRFRDLADERVYFVTQQKAEAEAA